MAVTPATWTPSSWRGRTALHQPEWPDPAAAEASVERLRSMPPLVFAGEARELQAALGEVAAGRAFLLQAGDCAESFRDFTAVSIREKLKILLQMSVVMIYGSALPLVKVGRIAGQFAKPRSEPVERVGDDELPSFFGHMVNDDAAVLGGANRRSGADGPGVPPVRGDAQPASRLHEGRLRRPDAGADVEPGVRRERAGGTALRGRRRRDRARDQLHARVRHRSRARAAAAPGRRLDEPRGPRARLRGGPDAPRLAHRRLVRLLGAHALDRRAHAAAGRRSRRVLRRRPQPARGQARADGDRRGRCSSSPRS